MYISPDKSTKVGPHQSPNPPAESWTPQSERDHRAVGRLAGLVGRPAPAPGAPGRPRGQSPRREPSQSGTTPSPPRQSQLGLLLRGNGLELIAGPEGGHHLDGGQEDRSNHCQESSAVIRKEPKMSEKGLINAVIVN